MTAPHAPVDDNALREYAAQRLKERSDFRWHLVSYLVINLMMWGIWALTSGTGSYPWPVWLTLFWGVALLFHAGYAYRVSTTPPAVERELSRMRDRS